MLLTIEAVIDNIIEPINFLLPSWVNSFFEIDLFGFYLDEILVVVMSLPSFSLESVSKPLGDVVIFYTTVDYLVPLTIENASFCDLALNFLVLDFSYHFLGDLLFRLIFHLLLIQLAEFFSPNFIKVLNFVKFSGLRQNLLLNKLKLFGHSWSSFFSIFLSGHLITSLLSSFG